jgi:branched-chain amino acid transport system ATP-binding protein
MLELVKVSGGWGATKVVRDVSFSLRDGEAAVIIGRNGVGKTTLLELVIGRAQLHAGEIRLSGVDIAGLPTCRRSDAGLGYVPQDREVFPSLTVRQNLAVARRPGAWTEEALFALFPALAERKNNYAWQLSGGEQQMLTIARALNGNPKMILMDEPTEGLAPVVVQQLIAAIHRIAASGSVTLLIVEQRIETVLTIGDRCLIMDRGQIIHDEPMATLRREPQRLARLVGFESTANVARG